MDSCVLDTSVIIKSIFTPFKSLLDKIYERELETHKKSRLLLRKIEEDNVKIYLPKISVVETAAVVKRLSNKNLAMEISKSVFESYEIVDEILLFDSAWMIAQDTGCSGFDSYFIALANIKNATLLTDDKGMYIHANEIGVDSILIRDMPI